jgi:hypothetical protein
MTADEIVSELRALRYARPTMSAIANAAGISRSLLYNVIISGQLTPRTKDALERALCSLSINGNGNIARFRGD